MFGWKAVPTATHWRTLKDLRIKRLQMTVKTQTMRKVAQKMTTKIRTASCRRRSRVKWNRAKSSRKLATKGIRRSSKRP
jgi:hypothetical protein